MVVLVPPLNLSCEVGVAESSSSRRSTPTTSLRECPIRRPALRGYAYQDLMMAIRLPDLLLGSVRSVKAERPRYDGDLFDDLTVHETSGAMVHVQVKHHSQGPDHRLPLSSFTSNDRRLRLDKLVACVAEECQRFPNGVTPRLRLLFHDRSPEDPKLIRILQAPERDPGPFCPGMQTTRFTFSPDAIREWSLQPDSPNALRLLREGNSTVADLEALRDLVVIEVGAPPATLNMSDPGVAERFLLDRVRAEIGIGSYPNAELSAVAVAAQLIALSRSARVNGESLGADTVTRHIRLRTDFGAVTRAHPVSPSQEVARPNTVAEVIAVAADAAERAQPLVIQAPPGHGKSWFCKQFCEALTADGWVVAQHYCFLGQLDQETHRRVKTATIFGSLLSRLEEYDASLIDDQRPRFAANQEMLMRSVENAVTSGRKVALVIDGLDHVTRVMGRTVGRREPAYLLADDLAQLPLVKGATLVVLSQPGEHLEPLGQLDASAIKLPGLDSSELRRLAAGHGIPQRLLSDPEHGDLTKFVTTLEERSAGNGLYATYICRELLRDPGAAIDPIRTVNDLPPFDDTLEAYYEHLLSAAESGARRIGELLALLPFSVAREEVAQIQAVNQDHVDSAIDQLAPVLSNVAAHGGIRIYHESFARFLLEPMQASSEGVAILNDVIMWLEDRGFLEDDRAFRYLLPLSVQAEKLAEVTSRIGVDFVADAVAAGFAPHAIAANLATGASTAAAIGDWPSVVRCVELARAAGTYGFERLDPILINFVDVPLSLLGPDVFSNRLLFDGQPTVPPRAGLFLCDQLDRRGVSAPWSEYLRAYKAWTETDRTRYDEGSDQRLRLAVLRGQLRLESNVDMAELADKIELLGLRCRDVVDAVVDTGGVDAMADIIDRSSNPGDYQLALAERCRGDEDSLGMQEWTEAAVTTGVSPGQLHRLFDLGVALENVLGRYTVMDRSRLTELTYAVQESKIQFEPGPIAEWLDACAVAARCDPFGLATAEAAIDDTSWYGCWLRSTIVMCRAEVAEREEQPALAVEALEMLTKISNPFAGDPRACDLYGLRGVIYATLRRILRVVDDGSWPTAIALIRTASEQTNVTLFGEPGGPITDDTILQLVIKHTTAQRLDQSRQAVQEILEGMSGRYYMDVAQINCLAARFALAGSDVDGARDHWRRACSALVAYGVRKDDTISELLEPFPDLIERNQEEARDRLPRLEELCERVKVRTDGKGTHWVLDAWCGLLSKADPSGMAQLAATDLLQNCNLPWDTLVGAMTDLWEAQHERVPAHIAGALRLAIPPGQTPGDAGLVRRLVRRNRARTESSAELIRLLLARADERPVSYSVTDSDELVMRDDEALGELNELAAEAGQTPVLPSGVRRRRRSGAGELDRRETRLDRELEEGQSEAFEPGMVGIRQAMRTWRSLRVWEDQPVSDQFANAIGYRLLELVSEGRDEDAKRLIRSLADRAGLDDTGRLLGDLGEGFERYGQTQLAVLCHTLAWTRTRGGGGWMTFGGEDLMENLASAVRLDEATTLRLLGEEVARLVGGDGYGRYGITRALILAMNRIDWPSLKERQGPTPLPFLIWDQAYAVIESRLPQHGKRHEPWLSYRPADVDRPEAVESWRPDDHGDYEWESVLALSTAIVCMMSSASQEDKRRSLLAAKLLFAAEPNLMGLVLERTLRHFSDPTTVTWLLLTLLHAEASQGVVVKGCRAALQDLASCRSFLSVRAVAAKLLSIHGFEPPSPPVAATGHAWPGDEEYVDEPENFRAFVATLAGDRLNEAETAVPEFLAIVTNEFAKALNSDGFGRRVRDQLKSLGDRERKIGPDAVIGEEEKFEEIVQRCGAAARGWLARTGNIVTDPLEWEFRLAMQLSLNPEISLALERARIPRPPLPPPPNDASAIWHRISASLKSDNTEVADGIVGAVEDSDGHLTATVKISPWEETPRATEGPYEGWWVVASYETRRGNWYRPEPTRLFVQRACAVECRSTGDTAGVQEPPFLQGDAKLWSGSGSDRLRRVALGGMRPNEPVVGLVSPGRSELGVVRLGPAEPILTPPPYFVHAGGLKPGGPLRMDDSEGSALVLQTWRARYEVGDYRPKRALLAGSWLLMRPTAFARLRAYYDDRLAWREFVAGAGILEAE